jgi:hypothetical protein
VERCIPTLGKILSFFKILTIYERYICVAGTLHLVLSFWNIVALVNSGRNAVILR